MHQKELDKVATKKEDLLKHTLKHTKTILIISILITICTSQKK